MFSHVVFCIEIKNQPQLHFWSIGPTHLESVSHFVLHNGMMIFNKYEVSQPVSDLEHFLLLIHYSLLLIHYVMLWCWPVTPWHWMLAVYQISCDHTLYKMWAKLNNQQLSSFNTVGQCAAEVLMTQPMDWFSKGTFVPSISQSQESDLHQQSLALPVHLLLYVAPSSLTLIKHWGSTFCTFHLVKWAKYMTWVPGSA